VPPVDEALLAKLRQVPQEVFSREALQIASKDAELVPLDCVGRPGQEKLNALYQQQMAAEKPVRIIIVKSRQTGISTWIQGIMLKRGVTTPLRRILIVAHDLKTSGQLFRMGKRMYDHLDEAIRPDLVGFANPTRGTKVMHYGIKGEGKGSGLDSIIEVDTAEEIAGGRGFTYTDLHLSECAWWRDGQKALSLFPAVPDRPGTSIFLESTANGLNWFHKRYKAAVDRESEFEELFIGWHEDPDCWRNFDTPEQRAEFIESIGDITQSDYADEEPWLQEEFGAQPEQLFFRRRAITDKCEGKVELFKQEYPATWSEAFIGSGKQVFSVVFTQRAVRETEHWAEQPPKAGGPQQGIFMGANVIERHMSDGTVKVPQRVLWVPKAKIPARAEWWPGQFWEPRDPTWTVWLRDGYWPGQEWTAEQWREAQVRGEVDLEGMEAGQAAAVLGPGQYIGACDPADDIENNSPSEREEHAFNAITFWNHRTGMQTAQFEARADHDLIARQMFLAGLFFNEAWLSVERTGGYGNVILDLLRRRFYYRRVYTEKVLDDKKMREIPRLGWQTNRATKPQMEGTMQAELREGTHGFRSPRLAGQLVTYVKDEKGRHTPSPGSFSDLLMAAMQGKELRRVIPLRPAPTTGPPPNSMTRNLRWPH
jgi:hypothetical protein